MEWWILYTALILFWIVFVIGMSHISWKSAIRNEKKLSERGASPTSNARGRFLMPVDSVKRRGLRLVVTGIVTGRVPDSGDIVYLVIDGTRYTVMARRVGKKGAPDENGGVPAELKLFGGPGISSLYAKQQMRGENSEADSNVNTAAVINSDTDPGTNAETDPDINPGINAETDPDINPGTNAGVFITNLRPGKERTKDTEKRGGTPEMLQETEREEAVFSPLEIRRPAKNALTCLGMAAIGILAILMTSMAVRSGGINSTGAAVLIGCGAVLSLLGLYVFVEFLTFRLVIESPESITIRKLFREQRYEMSELRHRAYMIADRKERRNLEIRSQAGKSLAIIDDTYRDFGRVAALFEAAAEKRRFEETARFLAGHVLFVPMLRKTVNGSEHPIPMVFMHPDMDGRAYLASDSQTVLSDCIDEAQMPDEYAEVGIETLISMTANFTLADRIDIRLSGDGLMRAFEMNERMWQVIAPAIAEYKEEKSNE